MRLLAALFLLITCFSSSAYALASEESILKQARQHLASGNYPFATTWLQCLLRDYPASSHRQEALLLLIKVAETSGRSEKAAQYAADFLKEFPDQSAALDPELLKKAKFVPRPEPISHAAVTAPLPQMEPASKTTTASLLSEAKAETPAAIPAQLHAEAVQPAIKKLPPVIEAAKCAEKNPLPAKAPAQKPVAGAENGTYTLLAGETVNRKKLDPLLKKLKVNGLQALVRQEMKGMEVYRLIVACYNDNQTAREKQTEIARKVKDAFLAHEGDSFCVVASSLLSPAAAERGRQQLADRGVPVKVVKAQVTLPVWLATVGTYSDARQAAGTVKKLATLAIKSTLVKIAD